MGTLFSTGGFSVVLFLDSEMSLFGFGDFDGVLRVSFMFQDDLLRGVIGGGFVVRLSALI